MRPEERVQAEDMIRRLVDREGFEVLRLSVTKTRNVLLTLDADSAPITINDCVFINRSIRRAFEEDGLPIDDYSVDVESPGVKRELITPRHWERFVGERVRIRLVEPWADGTAVLQGKIESIQGQEVTLRNEGGRRRQVTLEEIEEARLDPKY